MTSSTEPPPVPLNLLLGLIALAAGTAALIIVILLTVDTFG